MLSATSRRYPPFRVLPRPGRGLLSVSVTAETGELAEAFIADALADQGIGRDQLSLHADRGTSMTSKPVAQLLVDPGVPAATAVRT